MKIHLREGSMFNEKSVQFYTRILNSITEDREVSDLKPTSISFKSIETTEVDKLNEENRIEFVVYSKNSKAQTNAHFVLISMNAKNDCCSSTHIHKVEERISYNIKSISPAYKAPSYKISQES